MDSKSGYREVQGICLVSTVYTRLSRSMAKPSAGTRFLGSVQGVDTMTLLLHGRGNLASRGNAAPGRSGEYLDNKRIRFRCRDVLQSCTCRGSRAYLHYCGAE